ncbi:hypothetical protein [Paeniglutamicibacter psychrophenolicus]
MYFLRDGGRLILLLCGGSKSSKPSDINEAYRIADEWKNNEQIN